MYNDGRSPLFFNLYHMKISTIILIMIVAVVVVGILAYFLQHTKGWNVCARVAFVLSICAIAFATLGLRETTGRHIKLIPFYDMVNAVWPESIMRVYFQNIILFCPLGIFAPFVLKCNMPAFKTILLGLSLSLLIEIIQFVFAIGYSEVNDVIMNTLGTAMGCLAYSMKEIIERLVSK